MMRNKTGSTRKYESLGCSMLFRNDCYKTKFSMVLRIFFILFIPLNFLIVEASAAAVPYTVESVPNPKASASYNYVSNPDGVIESSTVSEIDSLLKELELQTTAQVAVVILNSIGDEVPKTFATKLFNYWGIGDREKDNGLLILLVMDQRDIEFETGKGMEGILPDVTCKRIQETYMVPYAKAGNFDAAVLGGVKGVILQIEEPENAAEIYAENSSGFADDTTTFFRAPVSNSLLGLLGAIYLVSVILFRGRLKKKISPEYILKYRSRNYILTKTILLNIAFPALWILVRISYDPPITVSELIIGFYVLLAFLLLERRLRYNNYIEKFYGTNRHDKHVAFSKSHQDWILAPVFFPMPFIFYYWWKTRQLDKLRNDPFTCSKCNHLMQKLDEKSDDTYLSKQELTEEEIHSVDYDVWHCNNCDNREILSYVNLSSKYTVCDTCKAHASYLKETKTIRAATTSSAGKGEKTYDCMNCHAIKVVPFVIPKVQVSSSSSGSGSSFSSGGSSGGSSFGGGSSGGGGSGSHW
jgi:uncharacterized protein